MEKLDNMNIDQLFEVIRDCGDSKKISEELAVKAFYDRILKKHFIRVIMRLSNGEGVEN
jgi:hypothetical protein